MSNTKVTEYGKKPRIYVGDALTTNSTIALSESQAHYFKNVLRRTEGDDIRIFNGMDGEWLATLKDIRKKSANAALIKQIKPQPTPEKPVHLLFAPIKKARLDLLIEKTVELGVTDLHAVKTDYTQNHTLKPERIEAQIIEAAEQCERMTLPRFHGMDTLHTTLQRWSGPQIFWANERGEDKPLTDAACQQACGFLIGPEGGFSGEEIEALSSMQSITPISLGPRILRAETGAFMCLSHVNLKRMKNG